MQYAYYHLHKEERKPDSGSFWKLIIYKKICINPENQLYFCLKKKRQYKIISALGLILKAVVFVHSTVICSIASLHTARFH